MKWGRARLTSLIIYFMNETSSLASTWLHRSWLFHTETNAFWKQNNALFQKFKPTHRATWKARSQKYLMLTWQPFLSWRARLQRLRPRTKRLVKRFKRTVRRLTSSSDQPNKLKPLSTTSNRWTETNANKQCTWIDYVTTKPSYKGN